MNSMETIAGKGRNRCVVLYVHVKGGSASEAEHYRSLFPQADVYGFDYRSDNPWDAKMEFAGKIAELKASYAQIVLVANSIGAYFSMNAGIGDAIEKAYLISPIVNMERLILDMMQWANVTEEELKARGNIETAFGETLSWDYLCWVRSHPVAWNVPTRILYGSRDHLQSIGTIQAFAGQTGAEVTVMENGEHWFHTEEQMAFLDRWISR